MDSADSVAHGQGTVTVHPTLSRPARATIQQPRGGVSKTPITQANRLAPSEKAKRAAAWAAGQGFKVFPLAPDAKRPMVRDWEHSATDRADYIAERWPKNATGYGIACGPSGLYVIDCDTPKEDTPPPPEDVADATCGLDTLCLLAAAEGEPMPSGTLTVRTGRGGYHYVYRMPQDADLRNTASALGWLIDTRGPGGYIVGPGSTVNGLTYDVIDQATPAQLPAWIVRRLTEQRARAASHGGAVERAATSPVRLAGAAVGPQWAAAALTGEAERIRSAPDGQGNAAVNAAAYAVGRLVGGRLLDRAAAEAALVAALDTWSFDEPGDRARMLRTLRNGLAAGEANPRTPQPREQLRRGDR